MQDLLLCHTPEIKKTPKATTLQTTLPSLAKVRGKRGVFLSWGGGGEEGFAEACRILLFLMLAAPLLAGNWCSWTTWGWFWQRRCMMLWQGSDLRPAETAGCTGVRQARLQAAAGWVLLG